MAKIDLLKARVASLEILNHRLSGNKGVTPGGFYQQEDGDSWYVKHHSNPEHAYVEHLANQVYRHLGHNAPHSMVLKDHNNKPVYLSKKIKNFETHSMTGGFRGVMAHPNVAHKFLHGLAADTLLGNYDLHANNTGFIGKHATARIDNGSSLHFHATGGLRKEYSHEDQWNVGWRDGYKPHEIINEPHRDAMYRTGLSNREVLSAKYMGPHVNQIIKLRDRHGGWRGFVNKHIPGASEDTKHLAARVLDARTDLLKRHIASQHITSQED